MDSNVYVRVSGEMVKSLRGSTVCILGKFKKVIFKLNYLSMVND
jgi:hypothetical protein